MFFNFNRTCLLIGLLLMVFTVTGCRQAMRDFNRAPEFSPVRADIGYQEQPEAAFPPQPIRKKKYSLYHANSASFYRDPRATRPGDVLTVLISINDRANLNNKSDMKRNSETGGGVEGSFGWFAKAGGDAGASSKSSSKGDAKVERREDIRLSVAAVVSDVLPNGNLVINGSQEVRVNNELRVLNIAGIVRPRDIAGNNTINYDKIAEARISYGGRGRMSEVQQPPYGQQLFNRIAPF